MLMVTAVIVGVTHYERCKLAALSFPTQVVAVISLEQWSVGNDAVQDSAEGPDVKSWSSKAGSCLENTLGVHVLISIICQLQNALWGSEGCR